MLGRPGAGRVFPRCGNRVNDYMRVGVEAPFGGYKNGGCGREKGFEALREHSQVKAVMVRR